VASIPTLQHALPALEKLYASWEKAASKPRYKSFALALTAGMEKLNSYYKRSAESDAHIMAMGGYSFLIILPASADLCAAVLDPSKKMSYFHKHWPSHLVSDIEEAIQSRVSHLLVPCVFYYTFSLC
jgi:hypothetical protein